MRKKKKKQKAEPVQPEAKVTRQSLMLKAKERGIKNFRVLNKKELESVLADGVTQDQINKVVSGAVARWKSGWGSKKDKAKTKP